MCWGSPVPRAPRPHVDDGRWTCIGSAAAGAIRNNLGVALGAPSSPTSLYALRPRRIG